MATTAGPKTDNREHWRAATDSTSNYFTATDVLKCNGGDPGTDFVVRVATATKGEIESNDGGRKSKKKCVMLRLEGHEKPLGLNVTNATTLESLTGTPYYVDWNDQRPVLALYVEPKTNNGKPGVRIRSQPIAKAVTDLFVGIDEAADMAAIERLRPRLREAPAKFKPALKVALDLRIAKLNDISEGSGRD